MMLLQHLLDEHLSLGVQLVGRDLILVFLNNNVNGADHLGNASVLVESVPNITSLSRIGSEPTRAMMPRAGAGLHLSSGVPVGTRRRRPGRRLAWLAPGQVGREAPAAASAAPGTAVRFRS